MLPINLIYNVIVLIAFAISFFTIPYLIYASLKYKLFDQTDLYRKTHKRNISRLGGVAIFTSFIITAVFSVIFTPFSEAYILILCCIFLSVLGLKDDMYGGVSAKFKFSIQLIAAVILVTFGGFRLSSLYGVFGIWEMSNLWGALFSIALIIFLNNAVNLIDGIDGLAGSVGVFTSITFGILFAFMGQLPYAFIAFALGGAILGFLRYNWYPAKIFMGDTGALVVGLTTGVLAIKFIELNNINAVKEPVFFTAPAKAVGILIIPIFDSLRIFGIRILNKQSPFKGDRNHIHHRLERIGYKPNQIVWLLIALNITVVLFTILFSDLGNFIVMALSMLICMVFNLLITLRLKNIKNIAL